MRTPTQSEDVVLVLTPVKNKQQASQALFLITAQVLNS
jgi:hypothetical protein